MFGNYSSLSGFHLTNALNEEEDLKPKLNHGESISCASCGAPVPLNTGKCTFCTREHYVVIKKVAKKVKKYTLTFFQKVLLVLVCIVVIVLIRKYFRKKK